MSTLRTILTILTGIIGSALYLLSIYGYLIELRQTTDLLGAAIGFVIFAASALLSSVLLAISSFISKSRLYKQALLAPWIVGILAAAILSYDLAFETKPGGREAGEVFRPDIFLQALALAGGPYLPLLLASIAGFLGRK